MKAVLLVIVQLVALALARAPLVNMNMPNRVPDQYLVVLQQNTTFEIRETHLSKLSRFLLPTESVIAKWSVGTLIGYSAKLRQQSVLNLLEVPDVLYVEADQYVTIVQNDPPETQLGATWGIDRIDSRALPLDQSYTYFSSAGTGVDAYIIDTGILVTHNDFGGRAFWGTNTVPGESEQDCNGHGTHVSGTIGGAQWGVSKKVTLWAVKVLGCSGSGTWTGVIQGIDWVTTSYQNRRRPSVANMSLGGGAAPTVDAAVQNSIAAGVHYAIAAGNSNANACLYSPARVLEANTAGATTNTDARASYSNIGTCLDIFAPGSSITSAWIGSNTATNTISGTSMAAPHVAGAIAQRLGHNPNAGTPAQVSAWLASVSTPNVVTSPGTGSPNRMLYSPFAD